MNKYILCLLNKYIDCLKIMTAIATYIFTHMDIIRVLIYSKLSQSNSKNSAHFLLVDLTLDR